jgi:hypothetical protein
VGFHLFLNSRHHVRGAEIDSVWRTCRCWTHIAGFFSLKKRLKLPAPRLKRYIYVVSGEP